MRFTLKALAIIFLLICIGVHGYGLVFPLGSETVPSHILHLFSYCLCLAFLVSNFSWRLWAFGLSMLYPFGYHAWCVWRTYHLIHLIEPICLLVVILLPAIFIFIADEIRWMKKMKRH